MPLPFHLTSVVKVRAVGGTTVVTIPKAMQRALGLKVGSFVQLRMLDGLKIVLREEKSR